MPLSSFWDGDGQQHLLEQYPYSEEHWSLGDELDEHRRALLDRIEVALSSTIVSTEVRSASPRSLVLEVELENDRREIVRAPVPGRGTEMFEREVALLAWLSRRTLVPVPRIRCVVLRSANEPHTFAVMEKLPGDCLMNVFGGLSYADKESVIRDIAKIMLQLNELAVPQQVGTTLVPDDDTTRDPLPVESAPVSDALDDYLHARIEARRTSPAIGSDDSERARAHAALDRLTTELHRILAPFSSFLYRRCVLRHDDLRPSNILVDGNRVSGVVDWEFHSTVPVVLAATTPSWIRYDGIYDPRFEGEGERLLQTWYLASPEDAAKLRAVYSETVKAMSEEYWRVLVDGQVLQQLEDWLDVSESDPGCDRMSAWMDSVFSDGTPT
ncbi:kinase-like protein [Polyporus arcularius HHB13444]|uniref:Kinase-like protein n=1 Tax=Polyporus arcularius HHB13444 TaxID=1314778 RepID=A0A5C3P702_9APHY|nr:kinase-like protein [Polyporus arcularius HHB13444]